MCPRLYITRLQTRNVQQRGTFSKSRRVFATGGGQGGLGCPEIPWELLLAPKVEQLSGHYPALSCGARSPGLVLSYHLILCWPYLPL